MINLGGELGRGKARQTTQSGSCRDSHAPLSHTQAPSNVLWKDLVDIGTAGHRLEVVVNILALDFLKYLLRLLNVVTTVDANVLMLMYTENKHTRFSI